MAPRIAVICAYNPQNAGMYSVDLAAQNVFAATDFDLFVTQTGQNRPARMFARYLPILADYVPRRLRERSSAIYGKMQFRLLSDITQLEGYSHLVYWGDFQNNPIYGRDTYAQRDFKRGHSTSIDSGFSKWCRLFALTEGKPVSRVVSVGNNFQNDFSDISKDHPEVFSSIGNRFDVILPRDTYSVENLSKYLQTEARAKITQGLDCAFLLPTPPRTEEGDYFCFHFGRSGFYDTARFIDWIERETGLRAINLDLWFQIPPKGAHEIFTAMRAQIQAARFVVTDTYHVAVNAMTLGAPVYGIGRAAAVQDGTLGDFKKHVLFKMMDAMSFYTEKQVNEEEADFFSRCRKVIAGELHRDVELNRKVSDSVASQTSSFQKKILAALDLGNV